MSFKYLYSISDDFPNQKVNEDALTYQIRISDITIALDYIFIRDQIDCEIYMKAELSEAEQTMLDNIVYEHDGSPLENQLVDEIGFQRMQIIDADTSIADIDNENRLKVLASVIPTAHNLSGPEHLGQLSDEQIPSFITRDSELYTVSGVLNQNMTDLFTNYYTISETDALLLNKSDITHQHDLRYYKKTELDDMIITTHSGLAGLDSDDHLQYLTASRADIRYYTIEQIDNISGTLNSNIITKSPLGHLHDDRYYTENEVDSFLDGKSSIDHTHKHSNLTNLESDDHPQYLLANGLRILNGNLVVTGDLMVSGTNFISNTETVTISDNILLLNNGEVGQGISASQAGIEVDRGLLDNFRFVFDEGFGTFAVGISGSEHPVAIRARDSLIIPDGYIPYFRYNADALLPHYELTVSGSIHKDNIASRDYVDSTATNLQHNIDTKADINHTHTESDITDLVHDAIKIQHKPIDAPTPADDGKRIVYDASNDKFKLDVSGAGGGGNSFPFSYFYHEQDLTKSSTNQYKFWVTKLKMRVEIPSGIYRIGWFYQWQLSTTSRSFESHIIIDDSANEIFYAAIEPKDCHNSIPESGFRYVELEDGKHTIILEYKTTYHHSTAYIWNTELEFWKIG